MDLYGDSGNFDKKFASNIDQQLEENNQRMIDCLTSSLNYHNWQKLPIVLKISANNLISQNILFLGKSHPILGIVIFVGNFPILWDPAG